MDGKIQQTDTIVKQMTKGLTQLSEQVEEFHKQIKEIEDEKEKQFYA